MPRPAIENRALVKKPVSLSLSDELRKRLELYQEAHHLGSLSQTVGVLLDATLPPLPLEVEHAIRRQQIAERRKEEAVPKPSITTKCPSCSDTSIVHWPDGRWRCMVCMNEGTDA